MLTRRAFLPAILLAGCTGTSGQPGVTLDQAKAYAIDLIDALSAAGQTYVASSSAKDPQLVTTLMDDLQQSRTAIENVSSASGAKAVTEQVISFAQQLLPIVTPLMGAVAPYAALALAVLQAFVASLPPPPQAPDAPPAQLHRAALKYRKP